MIPFELEGGSDGRGHWTVTVPNVLFGTAPDGTFPANAPCTDPASPSDPPSDNAANRRTGTLISILLWVTARREA